MVKEEAVRRREEPRCSHAQRPACPFSAERTRLHPSGHAPTPHSRSPPRTILISALKLQSLERLCLNTRLRTPSCGRWVCWCRSGPLSGFGRHKRQKRSRKHCLCTYSACTRNELRVEMDIHYKRRFPMATIDGRTVERCATDLPSPRSPRTRSNCDHDQISGPVDHPMYSLSRPEDSASGRSRTRPNLRAGCASSFVTTRIFVRQWLGASLWRSDRFLSDRPPGVRSH